MQVNSKSLIIISALLAAVLSATSAQPQSPDDSAENFYSRKQIELVIGYGPGGGYDLYARTIARYLPRYIPGEPDIVPVNMPGAGTAVAAQYVMNVAPQDGTTIAILGQNLPFDQVVNPELGETFNTSMMNWIGNPIEENNVVMIWRETGIESIEDAFDREIVVGATAVDGADALYPRILNSVLGTKFKIIPGYPGGAEQNIAMENGEIDGRGTNTLTTIRTTTPNYLEDDLIVIPLQMGFERSQDLPDVPLMLDLATTPAEMEIFKMISAGVRIGRPLVTTPNVPAERLTILRRAFDQTMQDEEFLAEAASIGLSINPVSGEELQQLVNDVVNASDDTVSLVNAALSTEQEFDCKAVVVDQNLCEPFD